MLYRIRQFVRGILAKGPNTKEKMLIEELLAVEGQKLFYSMNIADQRHCLNVLRTAWQLVATGEQGIDWSKNSDAGKLLSRCCLLHDVGRGKFMGPIRKTWAVLLDKAFPIWSRRHGRCDSRSYVRSLLYRYYHHGEISSDMLLPLGMSQEAAIVALHHKKGYGHLDNISRQVLDILRLADGRN